MESYCKLLSHMFRDQIIADEFYEVYVVAGKLVLYKNTVGKNKVIRNSYRSNR